MTRSLLTLTAISAAVVYFDPAGYRWAGIAGAAFVTLMVARELHSAFKQRSARHTLQGLRLLHPDDFEAEVARWLQRDGWHVEHRGGTGDGGIDILARRRKETLAVQCKRYAESAAVSAAQVRDLYGAAVATGATAAVLITTGRVSGPAVAWAETLPPGPALTFHDLNCLGNLAAGNTRL
jgi:HJR/Mrr/RecB family endonuclease